MARVRSKPCRLVFLCVGALALGDLQLLACSAAVNYPLGDGIGLATGSLWVYGGTTDGMTVSVRVRLPH